MTPGAMLGPKSNHDLGVLLRLPDASKDLREDDAISLMLDVMGDKEFYCAAYSSKEQPHIEGLLETLADARRHAVSILHVAEAPHAVLTVEE